MEKIAIIGLGLVGNSIGMALKRATASGLPLSVIGFDPDRQREEAARRKLGSVDDIAPDLESAVQGARLVVIATPASAVREVLSALDPLLDEGATVTDTLPFKEQVMAWAGELLSTRVSFVGGHPFSRTVDLDTAPDELAPSADLFRDAPYCIMPTATAQNEALSRVIALAEWLGAKPLFMDPREHDSFVAAVSGLPALASAALLRTITGSPAWSDMSALAHGPFRSTTEPLSADAALLRDALLTNRQLLVRWVDQYLLALHDLRAMLESDDREALLSAFAQAHSAREEWASPEGVRGVDARLQADLHQAIEEARPTFSLMGSYLSERLFRKKEQERGR